MLIALAFFTAARAGEIQSIRFQDVDLTTNTLRIQVWKSGLEDDFPISPELAEELRRWFVHYEGVVRRRYGRDLSATNYLIPAYSGSSLSSDSRRLESGKLVRLCKPTVEVPWKPLSCAHSVVKIGLEQLGLPTWNQGVHTIRKAAARALFDAVLESGHYESALRVVQATLHHKHASTTEEYIGMSSERRNRDEFIRTTRLLGAGSRVRAVRAASGPSIV